METNATTCAAPSDNHRPPRTGVGYSLRAALLLGTALLGAGPVIAAPTYTVRQVATPSGWSDMQGTQINASGQVTGAVSIPSAGTSQAFLFDGTTTISLGSLIGSTGRSAGFGINASGTVAGWSVKSGGEASFRYSGGTMVNIEPSGPTSNSYGINNAGAMTGARGSHAYLYDGTMHDLGAPGSNSNRSIGHDINNSNVVVGQIDDVGGAYQDRAFYYDGTIHVIGALAGGTRSAAMALNDAGVIVGWSTTSGLNNTHAFLYNGTTMLDLGVGVAEDINAAGQVVISNGAGPGGRATLYDNGALFDINSLISPTDPFFNTIVLRSATSINDAGQILAIGGGPGTHLTYVLTPVPEPSSLIALGFGAAALLGSIRALRRREPAVA
jgi:probable HAF family extracellular repeat protein